MLYLIISITALFMGLFIAPLLTPYDRILAFCDGFVSIFVGGLVLFHIFPHGFAEIGYWALPLFLLGVIVPIFLESYGAKSTSALILVGLGFSLHAFLDGVGLQQEVLDGVSSIVGDVSLEGNHNHDGAPQANSAIVLAVLAHRIPIGLFLGFAAIRKRSLAYTFAFIISMSTIGGYFLGAVIPASGAIQALLGGALLHVITGHSFIETLSEKAWSVRVIGAIGGGVLLLLMNDTHAHSSLFLEIWSLGSLLLLVVMALQLPRHHCIACEDPEIS